MAIRTEDMLKEINRLLDKGVQAIPSYKYEKIDFPAAQGDEETVVLVISDLQIGHRTPTTTMRIIANRADRLTRRFLKIVSLHRKAHPIKRCVVFLLGDLIQSEEIGFKVSLDEMEAVLMDQIFEGAIPILERMLLTLMPHFPDGIDVYTVSGNHGKIDRFHSESTNFDTIIYRFLKGRLRQQKGIKFYIEAAKFYQKVKIYRKVFLLVHGDQIPMYMNLPWYGITTRAMRWKGSLEGVPFHYLVMGHFHVASSINWNDMRILVNGCFVSDDQWVLKKIGMSSSTVQLTFGVHPRQGITWMYQIKLD